MTTTDTPAGVARLERGYCPACGMNVAVKTDGATRQHTAGGGKCAGSGQPALTEAPSPQTQAAAQAVKPDLVGRPGGRASDRPKSTGVAMSPARAKAYDEATAAGAGATPAEAAAAAADIPLEDVAAAADAMAQAKASTVAGPAALDADGLPKGRAKGARPAHVPSADGPPILQRLPLDMFDFSPNNPRSDLGPDVELEELGNSIEARGLVEPVVARRTADGRVELIAGARRLEAARRNGNVAALDVLIRDGLTEAEALELALVENAMRRDLPPMDEANAYQRLVDEFRYTQARLAHRLGRSQSHVSKRLSLLKLPEQVKTELTRGDARLHVRDAETLAKLPAKVATEAFERAAAGGKNADQVGRNLPTAIKAVKAEDEAKAKMAGAVKTLEATGVRTIDWPGMAARLPEGVAELDEIPSVDAAGAAKAPSVDSADRFVWLEVLADVHATCPGHAAAVDRDGRIHYVCTNVPDLHPGDLDVDDDEPEVNHRRELEALEQEIAAATLARLDAMRQIISNRRRADDVDYVMAAYLETQDLAGMVGLGRGVTPEAKRAAVELLGVPVPPTADWVDVLDEAVPANGLHNTALALALAAGDRQLHDLAGSPAAVRKVADGTYELAPAARRHLRFLADSAGYQPAPFETLLVGDGQPELADADSHTTDAGSVDDWEDDNPPAIHGDVDAIEQLRTAAAGENPTD